MFKPYMHLERFGNVEVEGVELGVVHLFPKLDGANASIWKDERGYGYGSRNRDLREGDDNAGFMHNNKDNFNVKSFLDKYPHLRLYGEWLVPHTFKGYRPEAWRKFYVFDVYNDETAQYLTYEQYKPLLEEHGVEYVPPLAVIRNGDYERFMKYVNANLFLCPDGGTPGEGVVLKNYDYQNKFGRQCFAKIVRQEFKEENAKAFGPSLINAATMNEEVLVNRGVNKHLVDKTVDKIALECSGWTSKYIPRLLDTVYYDLVREELWDGLKEINYGSVNFKTLKAFSIRKVKELRPDLFQ